MGLDNGVILEARIDIPHPQWDWMSKDPETEICYWRKFWGFRNEIVTTFGQEDECADIYLDKNGLLTFIEILETYLDRDYYINFGESIWTYEEYLVHNIECLENLKVVVKYLEENPDVKCYFYDSY